MKSLWAILTVACVACGGGGSSRGDGGGSGGDASSHGDGPGNSDGRMHDGSALGSDAGSANAAALVACVTETNHFRTTVPPPGTGSARAPVVENAALEAYAATGAMVDFSTSPHDHFSATSGGGIAFAENECPQQGNWTLPAGGDMSALVVQCVDAFYAEGPGGGHYENMMGDYGTLGCGIYQQGSGVTIVQDYGD